MQRTRGPGIIGVFPAQRGMAVAGATKVWPDLPQLWTVGEWHSGEVRTGCHRDARLLVVGQCFASDNALDNGLRGVVDTGDVTLLSAWPGSYAVVLIRDDELIAMVDLAGQYPLYYRADDGRVVLGSQVTVTAAAAGLPSRPDLDTLAAQIFCPDVPMLTGDRSVVAGVRRLGGGQALRADREGRIRCWTVDSLVPDTAISFAGAATELRSALDAAVQARLATDRLVTADFSGGLDSTSVAFLAARHASRPLRVFTYHHPDAPADDLGHARQFALLDRKFLPEIVFGSRDTLTYHDLRSAGDLPDTSATGSARTRLRLTRIAASGSEIHLGGEGADALLAPSPSYMADMVRFGSLRGLVRHAYVHSRSRQVSPAAVLRRSVAAARTSVPRALTTLAEQWERPDHQPVRWLDAIAWWPGPGIEAAWLTTTMRKSLAELCRATAARADLPDGLGIADLASLHDVRKAGAVQRHFVERAREHKVWPHAPFLDNDVIRACTRAAAYRRTHPGTIKPLLGTAMAGLVPDPVLARTTKGNYLGEDYIGWRTSAKALATFIRESRLAQWGVVEPEAVVSTLRLADMGALPFPTLNRLLGVELWLRELESPC